MWGGEWWKLDEEERSRYGNLTREHEGIKEGRGQEAAKRSGGDPEWKRDGDKQDREKLSLRGEMQRTAAERSGHKAEGYGAQRGYTW